MLKDKILELESEPRFKFQLYYLLYVLEQITYLLLSLSEVEGIVDPSSSVILRSAYVIVPVKLFPC